MVSCKILSNRFNQVAVLLMAAQAAQSRPRPRPSPRQARRPGRAQGRDKRHSGVRTRLEPGARTSVSGELVGLPHRLAQRGDGDTKIKPRGADEFLCKSCFLVLPMSQLAAGETDLCRDCA